MILYIFFQFEIKLKILNFFRPFWVVYTSSSNTLSIGGWHSPLRPRGPELQGPRVEKAPLKNWRCHDFRQFLGHNFTLPEARNVPRMAYESSWPPLSIAVRHAPLRPRGAELRARTGGATGHRHPNSVGVMISRRFSGHNFLIPGARDAPQVAYESSWPPLSIAVCPDHLRPRGEELRDHIQNVQISSVFGWWLSFWPLDGVGFLHYTNKMGIFVGLLITPTKILLVA